MRLISKFMTAQPGQQIIAIHILPSISRSKEADYWSRNMFNFDFFEKGLEKVFLPYFVYDFFRKLIFMLYSINWPNPIAWLPLLFEILVIYVLQLFVN